MGWKSQAKGSRKQPIDRTFATESRKFRIHSSETKEHWVRSNFPGIFHSLVDYWNGFGHLHTIHPQLSSCFIQNLSLPCSLVADTVLAQKLCRNDVQLVGYLEYKHQMRLHFVLQRFNTSVGQWFWAVPMLATMLHLGSGPLLLRAHLHVQQQVQQWVKTWGWLDWFMIIFLIWFLMPMRKLSKPMAALREAQGDIQPVKSSKGPQG